MLIWQKDSSGFSPRVYDLSSHGIFDPIMVPGMSFLLWSDSKIIKGLDATMTRMSLLYQESGHTNLVIPFALRAYSCGTLMIVFFSDSILKGL